MKKAKAKRDPAEAIRKRLKKLEKSVDALWSLLKAVVHDLERLER